MLNVHQFPSHVNGHDKTAMSLTSDFDVFNQIAKSYQKTINGQEKIAFKAIHLSESVTSYLIAFAGAEKDKKVLLELDFCNNCIAEDMASELEKLSAHFIIEPIFAENVEDETASELMQAFA